jgi:hypothetical protein
MNKQRRQDLSEVIDLLDDAIDRLSEIRDDEQEALDNMPYGLQDSARGVLMLDAIGEMEGIEDDIDKVKNRIEKMMKK